MSELVLGVKQAGELQDAFRRDERWTHELIKEASAGNNLSRFLDTLLGLAVICPINPASEDTIPFVFDKRWEGWVLVEDVGFTPPLTPDSVLGLAPILDPQWSHIHGDSLIERSRALQNANLGQRHAEFLLKHPGKLDALGRGLHLLVFPGTIWSSAQNRRQYVCCLIRDYVTWNIRFRVIDRGFKGFDRNGGVVQVRL